MRWASLDLVSAARDPSAVSALTDALRRKKETAATMYGACALAAELARAGGTLRDEMLGALMAILDDADPATRAWGMEALRRATGEKFTDVAAWRSWWARKKP